MDKRKLNKVFQIIKNETKMDYAITNADEYGDCMSCVNSELANIFGMESKGIWLKHWLKGMNKGEPWKEVNEAYIAHDITKEQADIMISAFINNGYEISPIEYNPMKCFIIKERID